MALFGSGSGTAFWRTPSWRLPDTGGRPTWISLWTKGPTSGTTNGLAAFSSSTLNQAWSGTYLNSVNAFVVFDFNDALASVSMQGANATANVWQHLLVRFQSASARDISVDFALTANSGAMSGTQTMDSLLVGQVPNSNGLATDRLIAEVAFGRGVVDTSQIWALRSGQNPLAVLPQQIVGYFPLRGDLRDLGPLRRGLMPIGNPTTKWGEHPPVQPPPPKRWSLKAGAAAATFAATPAATATATAALTTQITLAATPSATSTATAALTTAVTLAAAPAAVSAAAAALTTAIPLAAAPAAVSISTAALTTGVTFAAAPAASSTATAALSTQITLAAAASATATATASFPSLSGATLAAAATASSAATAALRTQITLAASLSSVSTASARFATGAVFAAAAASRSSATANLTVQNFSRGDPMPFIPLWSEADLLPGGQTLVLGDSPLVLSGHPLLLNPAPDAVWTRSP